MSGQFSAFPCWTSSKPGIKCLAQGHVAVPLAILRTGDPFISSWMLYHWVPLQSLIAFFRNKEKGLIILAATWDIQQCGMSKAQTNLRIHAIWSEPLLVAWIFYDYKATDQTSFGVSKLKRRLHRLVWVYICQNATLLEISCGSNKEKGLIIYVLCFVGSISSLASPSQLFGQPQVASPQFFLTGNTLSGQTGSMPVQQLLIPVSTGKLLINLTLRPNKKIYVVRVTPWKK